MSHFCRSSFLLIFCLGAILVLSCAQEEGEIAGPFEERPVLVSAPQSASALSLPSVPELASVPSRHVALLGSKRRKQEKPHNISNRSYKYKLRGRPIYVTVLVSVDGLTHKQSPHHEHRHRKLIPRRAKEAIPSVPAIGETEQLPFKLGAASIPAAATAT